MSFVIIYSKANKQKSENFERMKIITKQKSIKDWINVWTTKRCAQQKKSNKSFTIFHLYFILFYSSLALDGKIFLGNKRYAFVLHVNISGQNDTYARLLNDKNDSKEKKREKKNYRKRNVKKSRTRVQPLSETFNFATHWQPYDVPVPHTCTCTYIQSLAVKYTNKTVP